MRPEVCLQQLTLLLFFYCSTALLTSTMSHTVFEYLVTDAGSGSAVRAKQHHIRDIYGRFALEDTSLNATASVCPVVALHHVHTFDNQAMFSRMHLNHTPGLAV